MFRADNLIEDAIGKFVEGAMRFARFFVSNPRDFVEEDLLSTYEQVY
jgi:hypothetical protein